MKIFDAHMHYSKVQKFIDAAVLSGVEYSFDGYLAEREAVGIVGSICMGLVESESLAFPDNNAFTPMMPDLDERPPDMYVCIGINPHTLNDDVLRCIRAMIKEDKGIVGFKIYAGYYHYFIHDDVYAPIYKLAAEYGLTVAIHTGDTYSENGLLEYSHPLTADRLAVMYRDTQFVLCHMGDPWIMDACEVAYKNRNVFLDISGLLAGGAAHIKDVENRPLAMQHYSQGLVYLNNYKKVLFGTDWPIVPMGAYVDFCKKIVPDSAYDDVFWGNAVRVYRGIMNYEL